MRRRLLQALCATLLACAASAGARAQDLTVFAAASLQNALEEIGGLYRVRQGRAVRFSFASSSALARQIEQDGPAAVFLSADEPWMDYLQERRLIVNDSRRSLLGNRLVLVVPADNPARIELRPNFDLLAVLGKDGRWVTGDPTNVPVGRYAQDALTRLGVWSVAQTRLVRAENVRVALAFVERGEAAAGIVYETDAALSKRVRVAGVFPANSHAPISYPMAIVARNDSTAARDFVAFLGGADAAQVFRKFGFVVR
jgi:molybdate transport system substrate-binding protein